MAIGVAEFADRLGEVIPVVMKEFSRRQVDELSRGLITLPQFLLLEHLERHGLSTMTALARYMGVTTAAMTGSVERLVRQGYIVRASDANDRRIIKVRATPKAASMVGKIAQARRQMILKTFSRISAHDRQEYLRILLKVRAILLEGQG